MSPSQIVTDRVLPVVTAVSLLGVAYLAVTLALAGSLGGCLSVSTLAVMLGVLTAHDIRRLFLKK
jgi:hypothetical protein